MPSRTRIPEAPTMPVGRMYVQDVPKSARTPEGMLKMVKLTAQDIADAAQKMFDQSEA